MNKPRVTSTYRRCREEEPGSSWPVGGAGSAIGATQVGWETGKPAEQEAMIDKEARMADGVRGGGAFIAMAPSCKPRHGC